MEDNAQQPISTESTDAIEPAPATTTVASPAAVKKRKKPPLKLAIIAAAVLLMGGAAAAYTVVQQNDPEAVWSQAMGRTADGFDSIVESAQQDPKKGGTMTGSIAVTSPVAIDGTVSGQWYESNLQAEAEVGVAGIRATAEVRAITAEGATFPDLYLNVDGLSGLDFLLGASNPEISGLVSEINGQWFVLDRTLLAQASLDTDAVESATESLTPEDIADVAEKSSAVLRDRVFTDDPAKAVFVVDEYLGKEDFDGKDSFKYAVKVQKEQLKSFVSEMRGVLAQTALADLVSDAAGDSEGSLDSMYNLEELQKEIESLDLDDARAEVWVDARGKFVRNVRITDTESSEGITYLDLGMPYSGGEELPFTITLTSEDDQDPGKLELSLVYNQESQAVRLGFDANIGQNSDAIIAKGTLNIVGSNDEISVEKPVNARSVIELLGLLTSGSNVTEVSELDSFVDTNALPFDDFEL